MVKADRRSAGEHARRALSMAVDFLFLKISAQRDTLRKSGVQVAALGAFGLAAICWLELTVYFMVRAARSPAMAALFTMLLNVIAMIAANALLTRWKRDNFADLVALEKRDSAAAELRDTRAGLLELKNNVIEDTTGFVHERFVAPIERYKMPVAIGITFVTGVFVARALFPARPQSRL